VSSPSGQDTATFLKYHNGWNVNYQYGQLPILCIWKIPHNVADFSFINVHSRNNVGKDQKFWVTDAIKQHFKKWCIWYNYTLFIWAIFAGLEKINDTSRKEMHMGTIDTCLTVDVIVVLWTALNIQREKGGREREEERELQATMETVQYCKVPLSNMISGMWNRHAKASNEHTSMWDVLLIYLCPQVKKHQWCEML
jgi:hypothetical protein